MHAWIARFAEALHMEKRDPYRSLQAGLPTLRDRLPVDLTVHFGAQLAMVVRGLYYEGCDPSKVPIKMSREEFLAAAQARIVADRVIDAAATVQNVLGVIASHMGNGELEKVMHSFPRDMQLLFPAIASAA